MSLEAETTDFRCGNCYEIVDGDGSMSSVRVCNSGGIETDEIQVIDAICYIYGISLEEIRTWTEQLKGPNSDLNDVHWLKGNSIHLCDFCAYALSDNYKAHKKFEQLSNGSSFVCQINKFRRGEWESLTMPIIKAEVDLAVDNRDDGDEDSFCAFNSDSEVLDEANDAQVSDSASEIKYNPMSNRAKKPKKLKKKSKSLRSRQKVLKLEYLSEDDLEDSNLNAEKTPDEGNLTVETAESSKRSMPKGPFKCELCNKKFDRKGKLREHRRHHSRKLLKDNCKICGKDFRSGWLPRHMRTVHSTEEERLKEKVSCQICDKLMVKESLKSHMHYQHSGEVEKFKCETCEKTFVRKQNYEAHMLAHSEGFTPFLCGQCGKTFNCKTTLANHEKIHSEKKFTCEVCSKQFPIKGYLKKHLKEFHATERKYVCEECGKCYKSKRHLVMHQRQHKEMAKKGGNAVQCDECGKYFKHSITLYKHKLRNHRADLKKVYQCDLCDKILSDSTCLRTHKKLVHKMFLNEIVSKPISNSPEISQVQS